MNTDLTPAPTPRTDKAVVLLCHAQGVEASFSRGLERELLAAHKETAERDEALNTIADELQLSIGSTPDQIAVSVRNELARGIHTCHENCQRPYCVLKREKEALSGALREEQLKTQALTEALGEAIALNHVPEHNQDREWDDRLIAATLVWTMHRPSPGEQPIGLKT